MSAPAEAAIRDWLRAYVFENLQADRMVALTDRLDSRIVTLVPQLADHELQRDLHASTRAQVEAVLGALGDLGAQVVVPVEAQALARTIARRGLELRVLMHIYRAGHQAAIEYLTDLVGEQDLPSGFERSVLIRMFEQSSRWLGVSLELLTDVYTEEREGALRGEFTRRAETVRAILSGDEIEADGASGQLGYRLSGRHIAFVLWTDETVDGDAIRTLDRLANRIATALGSPQVLTVSSGARGLWAWAQCESAPDLGVLRDQAAYAVESQTRVAFGARGIGVEGFRRSHREALAARQIAQRTPYAGWITDYLDIELVHLVSADAEGMRALISRELAGIDGVDANSVRLRDTLQAYLRYQGSPEAAARVLGVHKNTVRYRIQRIEELLGHDIDSRRMHLEIALACVDGYGRSVLPTG